MAYCLPVSFTYFADSSLLKKLFSFLFVLSVQEFYRMKKKADITKLTKPKAPSVFRLLKPYRGMIVMLLIFALASNAVNLFIPRIISKAIDSYSAGHFVIQTVVLEFMIAALVIFVFTYLQSIIQTYSSERVAKDLRKQMANKISGQSYQYIITANPSKLLTNLTSDIDSIKMFVSQAVVTIASSVFMIVGTCLMLIIINWKLALAIIGIIPIIGGAFYIVLKKVRVLFKRSREVIDWLNKVINESIMGSALIRVMNSQTLEYNKFLAANTDAKNIGLSILRLFSTLIPIITFVANLAVLTILALGGHFVVNGSLSLGNLAGFNSYLSLLIFPILMIGFMSNIIAQASASYSRIYEVLEATEPEENGTVVKELYGDIELKNIQLAYSGKPVLKEISFHIKGKSHTAIIGPTAAGKSQLLYLLTNLVLPDSGSIQFDGRLLSDYDKESFHRQIGYVFQDSAIFNLTLRENIAFSEKVTDDMLNKAIDTAELGDFIESLPDKLETLISERGTNLSGGQKQRIMLARALALNPKILFLDDFTARVDKKTEKKILCNLENNYPDLTLVSVTQKISSVKHFEKIILLMEGEMIAEGTHEELIEDCAEYVQIYNSQKSTSHYEL
jgi:ATP-binding cassette subfamily B protein